MGNLISWLFNIFKSGNIPEDSQLATTQGHIPLVLEKESSAAQDAEIPNTAKSSDAEVLSVIAYEGDYKELPSFVDRCYFDWMAGKSSENAIRDE